MKLYYSTGSCSLAPGSVERYRLMEWLSFVGTELHKNFSPFFRKAPEAWLDVTRQALEARFDFASKQLGAAALRIKRSVRR